MPCTHAGWVRGILLSTAIAARGQRKSVYSNQRVDAIMRAMSIRRNLAVMSTAVVLGMVCSGGCSQPVNREQLLKQVLTTDPGFASVLTKHRELVKRIETYQRELALKRTTVEQSVRQLRKELTETASAVSSKIDETKRRIEPDRKRLELALFMAAEELKAKRAERASLGRSIARLRKSGKSGETGASNDERLEQASQLQDMINDAARLDQEIIALKEHVHLIKIKLFLIKL